MRFEIRTLARAISTLVVLFVLVLGASLDAMAQGNSRWGRSHNRGRHLGWERGRRVGQNSRDNDRSRWRRMVRRERAPLRPEQRRELAEVELRARSLGLPHAPVHAEPWRPRPSLKFHATT
jgi:hypothetical protein